MSHSDEISLNDSLNDLAQVPLDLTPDANTGIMVSRRGRTPKAVIETPRLADFDELKAVGLKNWQHYHYERDRPFDWSFAEISPALGRLFLETIYEMSGVGNIIESKKTADSYRSYVKPFFLWISKNSSDHSAYEIDPSTTVLPPSAWKEFRDYIDSRVADGKIGSKSAYQYKGATTRILQRIWTNNSASLGTGWNERSFLSDDYTDDTKQREPYSASESRRILDYSTDIIVAAANDGRAEDPYDYLVEIACYTALSLRLGIESECLDSLKMCDVKPTADGSVMRLTYAKRRVRKRQTRSRSTDPVDPLDESATLVEQIGSFRTGGGLLSLMLRRARLLGKGPDDKLWLRRISASEFRRYTTILGDLGLRCDRGLELKIDRTKFRVTYKTAKNVRSGGRLPLTSDDNTPNIRARHYDESDRMKPFYEQAIENAGLEALAYALEGCKVVTLAVDAAVDQLEVAARELDVPVDQIKAALNGDTDVWLSSCRDFYNSPFDAPGRPCSKAFFKCLGCGNALVTRRSLPRVIRFLAHIVNMRAEISDIDWQLKFAKTYNAITKQILPRFPSSVVAEARIVAQGTEANLHIPPELLT